MFNDPKYKNAVNDIANILNEHNKDYHNNILSPAVALRVSACADAVREVSLGERTAEIVGTILKEHYYEASREDHAEVNTEKSAEFYRRVYAELKG
tara:strand:+ start:225 stop:512 length:288 start_codon:yes stop_codon:yes gene_type:complete